MAEAWASEKRCLTHYPALPEPFDVVAAWVVGIDVLGKLSKAAVQRAVHEYIPGYHKVRG